MKYTKKALALFLALCMMVTSLPLSANATEAVQQVAAAAEDVVASSEEAVESEEGIVSETEDTESEEVEVVVEETQQEEQQQDTTTDENVDSDINETEDAVENTEEAENADAVVVENESATETAEDKAVQEEVEVVAEPEVVFNDGIMLTSELDEEIATYAASNSTDTVYVLAGGDFQEAGDHANSAENVTNILAQVSQKYSTMDGFLFIGDYDCETHDSATETANGITALMGAVQGTYSNLVDSNSVLVQGNHDYMDSRIDATGGHDFDGYSVYVLNEDDYPDAGGSESGVKALAENLQTWLNTKIAAGFDNPIFITSHLPLAFGPRTNNKGDGKYAKYLFDVLNAAGEEGLNIIFMHGHDHAYGADNYLGGEAIYLAKGDEINIAKVGSQTEWTENTLNFTYMNAGYVGYYNESEYIPNDTDDTELTMTVFAITENDVTVERYSADGVYNLKSAGRDGYYSSTSSSASTLGLAYNTKVYVSPQTIELTTPVQYTVTDTATGVTVTSKYTEAELGLSVTADVTVDKLADTEVYAGYEAYTISTTADVSGDPATITIPVPTEYPLDGTIVYLVNIDGSLTEIEADITMVAGEKVAGFITTQPGTYAIAVKNESSEPVTITEYVRIESVDDLVSGEQYLIILDCSNQSYTTDGFVIPEIASNSAGTRKGLEVIESANIGDNSTIAVTDTYTTYEWTLTKEGDNWLISANDQYVYMESLDSRYAIYLGDTADTFSIGYEDASQSDDDSYSFYVRNMSSGKTNWTWDYNTSATLIYADGTYDRYETRFYIYKKTTTTISDDVATPEVPEGTIGGYVDISEAGNSNYVYTLDTDGIDTDSGYLIVGSSSAQTMTGANGTIGSTAVTISVSTASIASSAYEWKIDSSNRIYTTSGNTRYYLKFTGSYSFGSNPTGSLSLVTDASDATSWEISNNNGNYTISVDYTYRFGTRTATFYLRYNSNTFNVTTASNTTVRLYGGSAGRQDPIATSTEYAIAEGEKLYTVSIGATADQALAKVMAGITVSTATDVNGANKTTMDDSTVTWTWVDTFSTTPGYYTVEMFYEGKSLGTVEVQVAETGEGNLNGWVEDTTGGVVTYILDTNGIDYGENNKYIIVARDAAYALNATSTAAGTAEDVTISGNTATTTTRDYEYYFTSGGLITKDGSNTLYQQDYGIKYGYVNGAILNGFTNLGNGYYRIYDTEGTARSLYYNGSGFTVTNSNHTSSTYSVRLYKYTGITGGTSKYYCIEGATSYNVTAGTMTDTQILALVQKGITGYVADDANGTNKTALTDGELTWTWVDAIDPNTQGYYTMAISYNGKELGTVEVFVEKKAVSYYSVEPKEGYVSQNASQQAIVKDANGDPIYITTHYVDGSTVTTPLTVGMLTNNGESIDTSNAGTRANLIVTYSGYEIEDEFKLNILERVVNNYPEYPEEGAVKVNKTATGVDFQSSGIAQVELSASGVPTKNGADVIVMLDTSSSMRSHTVSGTSKTRAAVLEESLENLIAQFKTPGADGELLDLRVAIADFNGFYGDQVDASGTYTTGTPYDRDAEDMMNDDVDYDAVSEAKVYTGNGTLSAGAFVQAEELLDNYTLNYTSGTNYDYAMDAIYQMGTAIKQQNADNEEERDLYVIFMSDGAAMQWNYYHSQGASSLWNNWITGAWTTDDLTATNLYCTEHAYYYDEVDHDGDGMYNEHRMANAIKGSEEENFEVIRKTSGLGTATTETNMYMVPGLGAKMFSISFDAQADDQVTEASMDKSIASLASEQTDTTQYYYKVTSAEELTSAFTTIGNEIAYAATNARFVDKMGDNFNLQLETRIYTTVENGAEVEKTLAPVIEVITYDIYTRQDYLNGIITEDRIGDRKGTSTLKEVVKFSDDGTKAYSNLVDVDGDGSYGVTVNADGTYTIADTDDNIFGSDGVIYAKDFVYNTSVTSVTVNEIPVESESFYWKMGTITTTELALRYYVYLEGSMEGTTEAGSYATNEYATLYYDNYLGNACEKPTVSPTMAWKSANVSYAFYLVDENGNIIVNQTTGETGSFANKIAVTNPVVYEEILLNNTDQVQSIDVMAISDDVLPKYYTLYDSGAVYEVTINSNSTGSWAITKGNVATNSTYVTQYKTDDASAYSNALTNNTVGDDYTHTVVWFAVVWSVQAHPDTVVIDYGLPVDISVLTNDMFGDYGKLAGIGAYSEGLENTVAGTAMPEGFGPSYNCRYGTATADVTTGKVRYTLNDVTTTDKNGMQMQTYEKFAYAVNYSGAKNAGYYYDTVTVIPATTIYYEDSFLTYAASNTEWVDEGTTIENATQAEDRPGAYSLTDANNIYGYDAVNLGMSTFSLGTAKKVHVDSDSYATAAFTFYGTGFDVIGMTSNRTGTITIKVTAAEDIIVAGEIVYKKDAKVKATMVDTYYGYINEQHKILYTYTNGEWIAEDKGVITESTATTTKPENPNEGDTYIAIEQVWVATPDTANALYQVPVMQIEELPYGKYNVVITATYASALDSTTEAGYYLYLDAIRIYDPANDGAADEITDTTIENAYKADGEGWPSYIELRNKIIAANSFDNVANEALATDMEGLVFIDGDSSIGDAQISDYVSYGPNNEIYLAPGQRVAFMLSDVTKTSTDTAGNSITESIVDSIHIGIKSADGVTGTYTITNIAKEADTENNVDAGDYYGARTYTINTATDMYYDLTGWKNDIIVISNTGDRYGTTGIISLTNIKSTYTADPNGENVVSTASADDAYGVSTASVEGEEISSNETYMYMTPAAATLTLRSVNTPVEEETPDEVVPEEPDSDITEPEEPQPDVGITEPEDDIVAEIVTEITNMIVETINTIKNVFNWLFGWKGAN